MAYLRGGARCDAPLWPDHEIFLQATLYEKVRFCHFPARIAKFNNVWWFYAFPNFRKMGEFAVSIKLSEAESVSDSGGFAP